MYFRRLHKTTADALIEYALVLGIVSLALIGMNTYIKRGVQGRIKSMADNFISKEQVIEADPTTVSASFSFTPDGAPITSTAKRELLEGGVVRSQVPESAFRMNIVRDTVTQPDPQAAAKEAKNDKSGTVPPVKGGPDSSYTPGGSNYPKQTYP